MDEGNALAEDGDGKAHHLHLGTFLKRGGEIRLVLVVVPERLVVVLGDVVDDFLGIAGIPGTLTVVIDLRAGSGGAIGGDQRIVAQAAGNANADPVADLQQAGFLSVAAVVSVVGDTEQTIAEALVGAQCVTAIEGAATTYGVTQAIVEGADARSGHVRLDGVDATSIIGDFTEVPALTVEVGVWIDRSYGIQCLFHVRQHVMPHQVKAESGNAVLRRPGDQGVDHQLFHHPVLGRGIFTAG